MGGRVAEGSDVTAKSGADPIAEILKKCKTIAVVGLSSNPTRPSHEVTEYMQRAGYRIIPVNPNETEVLGEKSYARLEDVPGNIDVVNIFRRPEEVPPVRSEEHTSELQSLRHLVFSLLLEKKDKIVFHVYK